MKSDAITISNTINASINQVWKCWTEPKMIMLWNHASEDWECPKATNDLRVGGKFCYTMGAKDKSFEFDLPGTYTNIITNELIEYTLDKAPNEESGRKVSVKFEQAGDGILVSQTFEIEYQNPPELQRTGWQAILNNFKKVSEKL
jgi:uncharacterized protein YndB with AHSA1/START domain